MNDKELLTHYFNTVDKLRQTIKELNDDNSQLRQDKVELYKRVAMAKNILSKNQHRFKDSKFWDTQVYEFISFG